MYINRIRVPILNFCRNTHAFLFSLKHLVLSAFFFCWATFDGYVACWLSSIWIHSPPLQLYVLSRLTHMDSRLLASGWRGPWGALQEIGGRLERARGGFSSRLGSCGVTLASCSPRPSLSIIGTASSLGRPHPPASLRTYGSNSSPALVAPGTIPYSVASPKFCPYLCKESHY